MERKVIVIPKAEPLQTDSSGTVRKKRVCAYARVSTDFEDQKNSFNAQLDEFKKRIEILNGNLSIFILTKEYQEQALNEERVLIE